MAFIDIFLYNIIDVSIPIFDSNTISVYNDTSFLMIMDKYTRLFLLCAGFFFRPFTHKMLYEKGDYSYQEQRYIQIGYPTSEYGIIDVSIPIIDSNTISFSNDTSLLMIMDKNTRYIHCYFRSVLGFFRPFTHAYYMYFALSCMYIGPHMVVISFKKIIYKKKYLRFIRNARLESIRSFE